MVHKDYKTTCRKVEGTHILNGTYTLIPEVFAIFHKNLHCLLFFLVQVILLTVLSRSVLPLPWPGF